MQMQPHVFFSGGKCEEALGFYKDTFKGEIGAIKRWKEGPPEMAPPKELENYVMHCEFTSPSVSFFASDSRPTTAYGMSRVSLSLGTSDESEAKRVFNALAAGGEVEMPLEKAFWGGLWGMLTDKYGVD
ncbi:MAG TPA: VOC family protein, partial [Trinickia sp.]|nr:VOC family protein [Trinickia sp.]